MSSQSNLPCLHIMHTESHPSHCTIVVNLGDCPVQDMQPCPEQTFQLGPCLDDCPEVLPSCPPPAVPAAFCCPEHHSAWGPCPPLCATTFLYPTAMYCDSPQSKGGAKFPFPSTDSESCTLETAEDCVESFPLQHQISPLDAYIPETAGTCLDSIPLQRPILTADPSTFEVIKICSEEPSDAQEILIGEPCPAQCSVSSLDPCTSQSGISGEPCMPQGTLGTCTPQGTVELRTPQDTVELCAPQDAEGPVDTNSSKDTAKKSSSHPSPRAPFRLNTYTSTILERCLSRCQKWLHGMK